MLEMLRQRTGEITVKTPRPGLHEITAEVTRWFHEDVVGTGLLTLFIRHTSASLVIQENADPDVMADLHDFFTRLAPEDRGRYRHKAEGPDDMPAHIRAALTQTHLAIPVRDGALALGRWQGIYVFEHRTRAQHRSVALHLMGE